MTVLPVPQQPRGSLLPSPVHGGGVKESGGRNSAYGACLKMRLIRTATYGHEVLRTPCPAGWGQAYLERHTWPVPHLCLSPAQERGVGWGGLGSLGQRMGGALPARPVEGDATLSQLQTQAQSPMQSRGRGRAGGCSLAGSLPAGRTRVAVSATQPRPVQLGEGSTVHWPLVSCAALVSSQPPSSTW